MVLLRAVKVVKGKHVEVVWTSAVAYRVEVWADLLKGEAHGWAVLLGESDFPGGWLEGGLRKAFFGDEALCLCVSGLLVRNSRCLDLR